MPHSPALSGYSETQFMQPGVRVPQLPLIMMNFFKKVSLQTHGFFHILCYNPLLSLFFRWSNCSILGTSFLDFWFSNMSQVYLVHSWPSPGIIPFSKESWFFIMGTVLKDLNRALGEAQNFLVLVLLKSKCQPKESNSYLPTRI